MCVREEREYVSVYTECPNISVYTECDGVFLCLDLISDLLP